MGGDALAAFRLTTRGDRVVAIDLIAEPARLRRLDIFLLDP